MLVIVNCGLGNVASIRNMFRKIGVDALLSGEVADVERATKLILPGVGAFDHGMSRLHERGVVPALRRRVLEDRVPILGICLGMQLLSARSEEGVSEGLGWIDAKTVRLSPEHGNTQFRVPHMGWGAVAPSSEARLFQALPPDPRFYFVHSFHVVCANPSDVAATTDYGQRFSSAVQHDNIYGVQFHPEKSHKFGMALLKSFAELPC